MARRRGVEGLVLPERRLGLRVGDFELEAEEARDPGDLKGVSGERAVAGERLRLEGKLGDFLFSRGCDLTYLGS